MNEREEVTYGAAGQRLDRREILKRSVAGFTVLSVGARLDAQSSKPPAGRGCGRHGQDGVLIGDATCGTPGNKTDESCQKQVELGSAEVGQDYGCALSKQDKDCSLLASSSTYHADGQCHPEPGAKDKDCGLLGGAATGSHHEDNACGVGTTTDKDCGLQGYGGGTMGDSSVS